jgi:chromate reductase
MQGKPVFLVTLSAGALGGVRAQHPLRETLTSMRCALVPLPEVAISRVSVKVGESELRDQATLEFIEATLGDFICAIAPLSVSWR